MIKLILALLFSLQSLALTDLDKSFLGIGNVNYLSNPGFEAGKGGWTASGGTFAVTSSVGNVQFGRSSATWDSSAAAQTLSSSNSISTGDFNGLKGNSGLFSCYIKVPSGTATHTMRATVGATNYDQAITSSIDGARTNLYFPISTTGAGLVATILSVAANEPSITIDDCYLGIAPSISVAAISETVNAGAMTIGATTTAPTKATMVVDKVEYYRLGKYAIITYTYQSTGVGTNGSGDYLLSLPSGLTIDPNLAPYYITVDANSTANNIALMQPSYMEAAGHAVINATSRGVIFGAYAYSATQFRVGTQVSFSDESLFGSAKYSLGNTAIGFRFTVKVPIAGWSASQSAAAANQTDYGATALVPTISAGAGTVTSNSAFHMRKAELLRVRGTFVTGTVAASLVTITLPNNLSLDTTKITIANTSAAAGQVVGKWAQTGTNLHGNIVTATGTSSTLVYFSGNNSAGTTLVPTNGSSALVSTTAVSYDFEVPISGWVENQRAPTLIGSVTSNSVSALAIETVRFSGGTWATNTCAASPCTINSSSNSGITVTRASTGVYTVNFPAGLFSAAPSCTFTAGNNANPTVVSFIAGTYSATAHPFKVDAGTGGVLDVWGNIICMGPR